MQKEKLLDIFRETGALLDGHFLLTSGLHSPHYFQCAKVLQYPQQAELLCKEIADHFRDAGIATVISPAVGGIVAGQEVARLLGCRAIFAERVDGKMALRRGFSVEAGEKILAIEDVVTTGGSIKEIISLAQESGCDVCGVGFIVDRSAGKVSFSVEKFSLLQMDVITFTAAECPLCQQGSTAIKPGSRNIK